ncbi:aldolase/citrate lyase family protein [Jatrophihabitans sp.]|uniref:HpcH/HpaI aldolase family protein n=1 Tax=Jatrophihabitans sp. TaxID=1932789 RepID=UPI0030C73F8F|nr:2,4-dihydroxyhept-2-ene,7-dioic acid aldolase [Jatrophihabitans sp.]
MSSIVGTHRYAQRLAAGEQPLVCFNAIPDTLTAEVLAQSGFDVVAVDLQHGGISILDLPDYVRAIELHGAAAFVRVSWTSPQEIMRAADAGVAALIIPMVETVEQAELAARAARYPPRGYRSFGPMRPALRATDRANEFIHVYPMIETATALAVVDDILAVDGVDGLFVGPVDLGLSMGIPSDKAMRHPDVVAGLDACLAAARKHGKLVGTPAVDTDHARELLAKGLSWVSLGEDKKFVRLAAAEALAPFRS